MRFDFRQQDNHFFHVDSGECVGYVRPLKKGKGYSVHRAFMTTNQRDKIGTVNSMDDALPKLKEYYENNWPQWKRERQSQFDNDAGYTMYTTYFKWSFYGVFTVKQREDGKWIVSRCTDALLHRDEEATFSTAEVAKRVTDLHEQDGFSIYPVRDDGYSWEPY